MAAPCRMECVVYSKHIKVPPQKEVIEREERSQDAVYSQGQLLLGAWSGIKSSGAYFHDSYQHTGLGLPTGFD